MRSFVAKASDLEAAGSWAFDDVKAATEAREQKEAVVSQQALLVRTDGTYESIYFKDDLDYRVVKAALGISSPVTVVQFGGAYQTFAALIDDEARFKPDFHVNPVASAMWVMGHRSVLAGFVPGDVVFINSHVTPEGEMTGLNSGQMGFLTHLVTEHFRLAPRLYTQEHDGTWVEQHDDGTTTPVEGEPTVLHGYDIRSGLAGLTIIEDV